MNCQNFAEIISDLARDRNVDQVEANRRERALAHLDECAECNLRFEDERALTRRLQEMSREMRTLTAPARIEEQLLTAFRQSQRSEIRGQRSEIRGRWIVSVAAVVLVMLGVGLRWYLRHPPPGSVQPQSAVAERSSELSPSTVDVQSTDSPAKPEKQAPEHIVRRTAQRRPARSFNRGNAAQTLASTTGTAAIETENEVATRFMPIGSAGPINPQDGGQLVRVELPRTAMLSMGWPVNMDRYGERVKADVLFGADGLARAIRFVQ